MRLLHHERHGHPFSRSSVLGAESPDTNEALNSDSLLQQQGTIELEKALDGACGDGCLNIRGGFPGGNKEIPEKEKESVKKELIFSTEQYILPM